MERRFFKFKIIRIICTVAVGAVPVTAVLLTLTEVRVVAPALCALPSALLSPSPSPRPALAGSRSPHLAFSRPNSFLRLQRSRRPPTTSTVPTVRHFALIIRWSSRAFSTTFAKSALSSRGAPVLLARSSRRLSKTFESVTLSTYLIALLFSSISILPFSRGDPTIGGL